MGHPAGENAGGRDTGLAAMDRPDLFPAETPW